MRGPIRSSGIVAVMLGILLAIGTARAAAPATAAKTGELDLTFNQRSPLSTAKEIARRLNLKESELGPDYELASRPFKAYVPKNYDAAVPHGVFVYLGYKDSVSVATPWEPLLDKSHLIFITPVCHHGDQYPNPVPLWQTMGLAFDAVDNLKRLYNVDARRVYLMSFRDGSMRMSLGAADVFTGMLVAFDTDYCQKMTLSDRRFYPPKFPQPPGPLFQEAKRRGIVLCDPDFSDPNQPPQLVVLSMKRDGFANVMGQVTTSEDVHYPNLKPEWFEATVLPFLDKAALSAPPPTPHRAVAPSGAAATSRATTTQPARAASPPTAAPAGDPEAQRQLRLAKLYIQNGQPALARPKLEAILATYPKDPAAVAAKALLDELPPK